MKTFSFILINKGNMASLEHFASADLLADRLFEPGKPFFANRWVVIKNEKIVVDLSAVEKEPQNIWQLQALRRLLNDA